MTKPIDLDRILKLAERAVVAPFMSKKGSSVTNTVVFNDACDPTTITAMVEELKEARDIISNLISGSENVLEVNKDDIECRSDEDCDHCFLVSSINDAERHMKKWGLE